MQVNLQRVPRWGGWVKSCATFMFESEVLRCSFFWFCYVFSDYCNSCVLMFKSFKTNIHIYIIVMLSLFVSFSLSPSSSLHSPFSSQADCLRLCFRGKHTHALTPSLHPSYFSPSYSPSTSSFSHSIQAPSTQTCSPILSLNPFGTFVHPSPVKTRDALALDTFHLFSGYIVWCPHVTHYHFRQHTCQTFG